MNIVAKLLKIVAVIVFVFCSILALGSLRFEENIFFQVFFQGFVASLFIYGFGELIDIEDKKYNYLKKRFGEVDEKPENDKAVFHERKIKKDYTLSVELEKAKAVLDTLITNKTLETKGLTYDGSNAGISEYYFKYDKDNTIIKIGACLQKVDDKTNVSVFSTTENGLETAADSLIGVIQEHLQ